LQVYHSIHYPIFPPEHSMRMTVDVIQFVVENMPQWNPISISGYNVAEAGIPPVLELAFALADGIAYIEACLRRGLSVDQFAPRISFFFSSADDFFEEIAKFRAARRMWAKILKERFGAKDPRSMRLRFHVQTAGSTLTAQQPYNNIVRSAIEGLAAILGGAQSIHVNSLDEALAVPSEEAAIIALRTQQILAYEFHLSQTIDPLGGSFFIETLTDQVEERAWAIIHKIDEMGGVFKAIQKNYFLQEISKHAWEQQKKINSGEKILVGVNAFQMEEKTPIRILDFDKKKAFERVRDRVRKIKKERAPHRWHNALDRLKRAAAQGENMVIPLIEAFESLATTAEINRALRDVFGEYTHPMVL
jgi:methylmalonyl-CoA mutase N-terminal domain/subunit